MTDQAIVKSWVKNAEPWTLAVRNKQISSRERVTNQAIVMEVLAADPCTVLDLGCGEGWLSHALSAAGKTVVGIDVVEELVVRAQQSASASNPPEFLCLSYEAIAEGRLQRTFDVVVCNFSLLGKESVDGLFATILQLLNPGGFFIVQTLHPVMACGELAYQDGWRPGSWQGFSDDFCDPAPWYFRTLPSWLVLFQHHGLQNIVVKEPADSASAQPLSVILRGCR